MDDLTKKLQAQGIKVQGVFDTENFYKTLAMLLSNKMGMCISVTVTIPEAEGIKK